MFRPGMSVTAEIETRSRSGALTVPMASVTSRLPKKAEEEQDGKGSGPGAVTARAKGKSSGKDATVKATGTNGVPPGSQTNIVARTEKPKEIEVVFVKEGETAKMMPVKIGISDDSYWEVVEGLTEGQEVIVGPHRAISRELQDGKKVRVGSIKPKKGEEKEKEEN
jgi:HlyD family secretion protein